ncbi:MAG: hypothetical protein GY952_02890, partial [Rhodobacteraceae bacterium]|nr:hypothetical protein [Paracoccaceae bacterium]
GSNARKHFVKGHLTQWADNPNTLGAYAAALPGEFGAREDLAQPIDGKIYFAGEAMGEAFVALCAGAHKSGENTTGRLLAELN